MKNCKAEQLGLRDRNNDNRHRRRKEEDNYSDRRIDRSDEEENYTEKKSLHLDDLRRDSYHDRQHRQKGHRLGKGQFGHIQKNYRNQQRTIKDTDMDKDRDLEDDDEPEPR